MFIPSKGHFPVKSSQAIIPTLYISADSEYGRPIFKRIKQLFTPYITHIYIYMTEKPNMTSGAIHYIY